MPKEELINKNIVLRNFSYAERDKGTNFERAAGERIRDMCLKGEVRIITTDVLLHRIYHPNDMQAVIEVPWDEDKLI